MIIFPAIDIIDGHCVRLYQGDFQNKTIYHHSPVEMAQNFKRAGLEHLHLVDLDGAKNRSMVHGQLAIQVAKESGLKLDFGGGISQVDEVGYLLEHGISQVNVGSLAIKNPEVFDELLTRFGPDSIILSADVKGEQVAIHGWMENSELSIWDFLSDQIGKGVIYCTITDISKDGAMQGPSLELYHKVRSIFPNLKLIASGGVTCQDDLYKLREIGCYGAIVGKAIYEKSISLKQLGEF